MHHSLKELINLYCFGTHCYVNRNTRKMLPSLRLFFHMKSNANPLFPVQTKLNSTKQFLLLMPEGLAFCYLQNCRAWYPTDTLATCNQSKYNSFLFISQGKM